MDLRGRNVLITGASRGIGAATARELATRGARLALVGPKPQALSAVTAELGHAGSGGEHIWAEADVTDTAGLRAAVDHAVAVLGSLDVVVANAGIASVGTVRGIDPESFAKTVDVNLTGVFRTVHASLPHLIESRGHVLIVSSMAAFLSMVGSSAYGASKAGVEAFADALRIEVAPLGVTVGCAYMSWVDTDMIRNAERDLPIFREMRQRLLWPLRSTTSAADCAVAFARAIERRSRRINVPRAIGLFHWIRPLVHSRLVDALTIRMSAPLIPRLEAEISMLDRLDSQHGTQPHPPEPQQTHQPHSARSDAEGS